MAGLDDPVQARRSRRRRRRLLWSLVLFAVLLGWGLLAARQGLAAYRADRAGLDRVYSVAGSGSALVGKTGALRAAASLRTASADFAKAESHLASPLLAPLSLMPVVGRQLSSVAHLSRSAAQISTSGSSMALVLATESERLSIPSQRQGALSEIVASVDSTLAVARGVNLGPSQGLISPLGKKRSQFSAKRDELVQSLSRLAAATSAMAALSSGSHHVLVLAASNAEMRMGSGSFLAAMEVSLKNGIASVGPVVPTGSLSAPSPVQGRSATSLQRLWGFSHPATYLDSLGLDPSFPPNAAVASRIWSAAMGVPRPSTVLYMDASAFADLLASSGPQSANGITITGSNATQYLMHQQYLGQPPGGGAEEATTNSVLGAVAKGLFARLSSGGNPVSTLGALARAAGGRHLMVWSASPALEADWARAGVSGQVGPSSLLLGMSNLGANKLDPYLRLTAHLLFHPVGNHTVGTVTVEVANLSSGHHPSLIQGPAPGLGLVAGQYLGLLELSMPGDATATKLSPRHVSRVIGREGRAVIAATEVSVLPGHKASASFSFTVPYRSGRLYVLPSSRLPPSVWYYRNRRFIDAYTSVVTW